MGRDNLCRLSDGRTLGWAEFGSPGGEPVLYFHGWPGSRLEASLLDAAAQRAGVRLIAVDRPGIGLSTFAPKRALRDWPADVWELVDRLQLDRPSVLGVSGGGPYAVACACRIGDRLHAVGLVSGLAPLEGSDSVSAMHVFNRLLIGAARRAPATTGRLFAWGAFLVRRFPLSFLRVAKAVVPAPDRSVLESSRMRKAFLASLPEIYRSGSQGVIDDGRLYLDPWGIALDRISCPVHLWQGEADTTVPVAMGRQLADDIPACQPRFFADEGHLSLIFNRGEEILRAIIGND